MQEMLRHGPFPFPITLFFFTMEKNRAWYAWVAEPIVSSEGNIELRAHDEAACRPLDDRAVDAIIDRVNAGYDAYYARVSSLTASNA